MRTWPGLWIAPAAFMVQFPVAYALVPWACSAQNRWVLHAIAGIAFVIAIAGTLYAARAWRALATVAGGDAAAAGTRDQFLAIVGTLMSALFMLGIAAQWFVEFVVPPCIQ